MIVAGSDTSSNALANAFFYLLTHPDAYMRLRKEVDAAFPADVENLDTGVLTGLPFLQAVM